jgi:cyanophycin synthetase
MAQQFLLTSAINLPGAAWSIRHIVLRTSHANRQQLHARQEQPFMKILELKTMRGPNYWSVNRHQLIVVRLDLEALEREPTHKIAGFADRLRKTLPSLQAHRCSKDREGGFFEVVEGGTWMGHVVMHIALELQNLAGSECSYGRIGSTHEQGVYNVIFEYGFAEAGKYAAEAAVRLAQEIAEGKVTDPSPDISTLSEIISRVQPGPSTSAILEELKKRNIPFKRLNNTSLYIAGHGVKQKLIRASVAGTTSAVGITVAKNKHETKQILGAAGIPVPKGVIVHTEEELHAAVRALKFPLVIKPHDGNHGRGITTGIRNIQDAIAAFQVAKEISLPLIAEEYLEGDDYRLLLINHKMVAAAKRTPAAITGDGKSTIGQLIGKVNSHPERGEGHDNLLTKIEIDSVTESILAEKELTLDSVPEKDQEIPLKYTANLSTGGTSDDVTDEIHPYNVFMAERISRLAGLDICGLDIVAHDLNKPVTRDNGGIVEVNAGPGLRMHLAPSKGTPRNVGKPIADMLFPGNENGRIPLVTVTGTNGKTTTTRMIAHLAKEAGGKMTGYTTTDGIYLNGELIYEGDCTGPASSETVLFDPSVEFAVLECARGGMLREGLAFNQCDIAIVTNVSADHLGLKDINTVEEMARVKQVLPSTVHKNGFAILNADDDLVYEMRLALDCHIALFSTDSDNARVRDHRNADGAVAVIEDGDLVIYARRWRTVIGRIGSFPVTLEGRAESMISNILPAALAAYLSGFEPEAITSALLTFVLSSSNTPGRMNIFRFPGFEVMVDYAHNPHGMRALKKFMDQTRAGWKVGIIGIAGDRRDEDIREMGAIAASAFDEVIVRHDVDLRGRNPDDMTALLIAGIHSENPGIPVKVITEELKAVEYAVGHAKDNSFITVCSEKVKGTLEFLEEALERQQAILVSQESGTGNRHHASEV